MTESFLVFDDVLTDPLAYRAAVLATPFTTVAIGLATFHGIAKAPDSSLPGLITAHFPRLSPLVTFCRQSPAGQAEPNYIHTDLDMGEWTAILYLTPDAPASDGTTFWKRRATGAVASVPTDDQTEEWLAWRDLDQWEPWHTVPAKFNRALLFPSAYFHSRALPDNYGDGASARLIQVVFGAGRL